MSVLEDERRVSLDHLSSKGWREFLLRPLAAQLSWNASPKCAQCASDFPIWAGSLVVKFTCMPAVGW
eukprot:2913589-Pyramimonas_sp.AAC.1